MVSIAPQMSGRLPIARHPSPPTDLCLAVDNAATIAPYDSHTRFHKAYSRP